MRRLGWLLKRDAARVASKLQCRRCGEVTLKNGLKKAK